MGRWATGRSLHANRRYETCRFECTRFAGSPDVDLFALPRGKEPHAEGDRIGDVGDLAIRSAGLLAKHRDACFSSIACRSMRIPLARSVIARRANAPPGRGTRRIRTTRRRASSATRPPHVPSCVREDPAPGGFADEGLVLDVQDRDDRARRLRDDPADQLERVRGAFADDHDGGVGAEEAVRAATSPRSASPTTSWPRPLTVCATSSRISLRPSATRIRRRSTPAPPCSWRSFPTPLEPSSEDPIGARTHRH